MKKLFAVLAIVGVMTSCKDKKAETPAETPTETPVETPTETPTVTDGVPTFSDPDVNAYVKSYEDYINAYKAAVESKDMTKMADLGTMGQDLATKGAAAAQKLAANPEESQKLATYMTAKANEVMELSKKLTGQ